MDSLPLGVPFLLKAGVAYALPPVKCTLFSDGAGVLNMGNTAAFTTSAAITLANGSATLTSGFIKAVADTLVTLKRD